MSAVLSSLILIVVAFAIVPFLDHCAGQEPQKRGERQIAPMLGAKLVIPPALSSASVAIAIERLAFLDFHLDRRKRRGARAQFGEYFRYIFRAAFGAIERNIGLSLFEAWGGQRIFSG